MAGFVASHAVAGKEPSGVAVSQAYMKQAADTAAELEEELTKHAASGSDEHAEVETRELKAKITMCHYLVIIACGCSAEYGTARMRCLAPYAEQLCQHMLLVRPEPPLYCPADLVSFDGSSLLVVSKSLANPFAGQDC